MRPFSLTFQGEPEYARLPFASEPFASETPAVCLITSCSASEVFYRSLGIDSARVFACTQVHGRDVLLIDRYASNAKPQADGMISRDPLVWLSITVGDCLPIFLYDRASGGVGAVHSGWKGTGIAVDALRLMGREWRAQPEDVSVILGPCIQGCCYCVDEERARFFEETFGGPGGAYPLGPVIRRSEGRAYLNLQAANARLLVNAGVAERNIAVCRDCTFTDERLGSFRRQGAGYTRMTALIGSG